MPPILDYPSTSVPGVAGQIADTSNRDIVSRVNDSPRTAQVSTVTVDTVTSDATYTLTVNGLALSYTADSTAVNTEIVAGLKAAIEAEPLLSGRILAVATSATVLTLTERVAGSGGFTISTGDAKLIVATTTAADEADPIGFGLAVIGDTRGRTCKAPAAASITARSVVITPTAVNNAVYTVNVVHNGVSRGFSYTADGDALVKEIVEGLAAAINGGMPANSVVATEDDATLTLTAEVKGEDFAVVLGPNLAQAAFAGQTLADVFVGVTVLSHAEAHESEGYPGGATCAVIRKGRIFVETEADIASAARVFVRVAGSGTIGAFTTSRTAGETVELPPHVASWAERISATLAVLEVNAFAG